MDENDVWIIRQEVELTSLMHRIDAYVIESVLFGALAFTAFVQIASTEHYSAEKTAAFVGVVGRLIGDINRHDWTSLLKSGSEMSSIGNLFYLLLFENLVCALFFLSVIIARLRASDVTERVKFHVDLAQSYNRKEEDLYINCIELEHDRLKNRMENLSILVNEEIHRAQTLFREVGPVFQYMRLARNAGVGVFIIILITSALMLSPWVSIAFAVLSVFAYLYATVERWIRESKIRKVISNAPKRKVSGDSGHEQSGS